MLAAKRILGLGIIYEREFDRVPLLIMVRSMGNLEFKLLVDIKVELSHI